jgi:hypothetical protein
LSEEHSVGPVVERHLADLHVDDLGDPGAGVAEQQRQRMIPLADACSIVRKSMKASR